MDVALVAAVALTAAWNTRHNGFVWDDRAAVVDNADARAGGSPLSALFRNDFWGTPIHLVRSHKSYRPLTVLSFRLNDWWHGREPEGYHLLNVAVHALCAVLVYLVGRTIDRLYAVSGRPKGAAEDAWGTRVAALLFGVHPIHCDAVASVVGRADLLCTAFALAGFLAYVQAMESTGTGGSTLWTPVHRARVSSRWFSTALALALALASSLCKELGFTTFGVYVATEVVSCLRSAARVHWTALLRTDVVVRLGLVIGCTLVLAMARVALNGEQRVMHWPLLSNHVFSDPRRGVRAMTYAHIHAWYLWKLLWPSWLSFDYGINTIPLVERVFDPRNLLTLLAYLAVLAGLWLGVRHVRSKPTLLYLALGAIPFIPASNLFFPVGTIVAERLLYLPSVGFCLLVGHALQRCFPSDAKPVAASPSPLVRCVRQQSRRWVSAMAAFILLAAMAQSRARNAEWKSEETLFEAAVRVVPTNVKALNNVVKIRLVEDPAAAVLPARVTVGLLSEQVEGHTNAGLAFDLDRHTTNISTLVALRHVLKAPEYSGLDVQGIDHAGSKLFFYWTSLHAPACENTETLMRSPTVRRATQLLLRAVSHGTRKPNPFYVLALYFAKIGDLHAAKELAEEALQRNDFIRARGIDLEQMIDNENLYRILGAVHHRLGDREAALRLQAKANERTDPQSFAVLVSRSLDFIDQRRNDLATPLLQQVHDADFDAESYEVVARLLEQRQLPRAAEAFFLRALRAAPAFADRLHVDIERVRAKMVAA
ncbi:hypothetical protein ATCC90586_005724 [Pythium insidiosum]|nr:hypothetical protein ATCC90586_005724 [Pythium insidiosum]